MATIDCSVLSCIPYEFYFLIIGISIAVAIFGFMRNPQIPAMLTFGGMFIMVLAVMFNGLILGSIPESSTITGDTTDYTMVDNGFDMSGFPQVMVALIGTIMMLSGGMMVVEVRR